MDSEDRGHPTSRERRQHKRIQDLDMEAENGLSVERLCCKNLHKLSLVLELLEIKRSKRQIPG